MGFREWYSRNKKDYNQRRKLRYATDPDYRDAVLTRSRQEAEERKARRARNDRRVFRAKKGELVSIGRLAEALGRKVQTVRKYHTDGVIPLPNHFDSRGWRLYTIEQLRAVVAAFDRFDRGILSSLDDVRKELKANWQKQKE